MNTSRIFTLGLVAANQATALRARARRATALSALCSLCTLLALPAPAQAALQISANGRHLVDEQGRPFLFNGDSSWSIFAQPSWEDAKLYLQDRADRGFNFLGANLLEHRFSSNPPLNAAGDAPFTGTPFITPNEAYFAHVDSVLSFAAERGIVFQLNVIYLGWVCGDQGWCNEVMAASLSDMREWGRFVGNRYGGYDNIMWSIGGDTDPSPVADKMREVVAGIREFDTDNLMTAHNVRGMQAITPWPDETWLQVNNVFSFRTALYQATQAAWENQPIRPFYLLEGFYENEHGSTSQQLRAQAYWAVLTGGFGVMTGNCPVWHFGYSSTWCGLTDWKSELDQQGSIQMAYYRDLFMSRRWHLLVPDVNGDLLTAGAGSWGAEDYATVAAASDGSSLIAYIPTERSLEFDTSVLTGGQVRVWEYEPADGMATLIGDFPKGLVAIAANSSGDRVIVIDDASIGFAAPGTPLATAAPTAHAVGVRLLQNSPNPFNPSTQIRFELTHASRVRISIFDASGRQLRVLTDESMGAGPHQETWDGRDSSGKELASGVYYCRLQAGTESLGLKLVLLK
ncbi:hypothetical protein DRQ53_01680 [bacterium]|nr:MAG: hypothetical protein DRQ32_02160 [bacterium]RKZ17997.1 MAG: hypothetical protein DRQ53_01680 [bacterium]